MANTETLVIAITKIHLHGPETVAEFLEYSERAATQAEGADGLVHFEAAPDENNPLIWFTLTVWKTLADMREFTKTGFHLEAMRVASQLGRTKSHHWQASTIPSMVDAQLRLYG